MVMVQLKLITDMMTTTLPNQTTVMPSITEDLGVPTLI
jgi:hypothetical protein